MEDRVINTEIWWEYVDGEELALFWQSPYGHGKEKIATFWWPTHPPLATKEVEAAFEEIASRAALGSSDLRVSDSRHDATCSTEQAAAAQAAGEEKL